MFQSLALELNKDLKKKVEANQIPGLNPQRNPLSTENMALLGKLAKDEKQSEAFLEKIWKKSGNFSSLAQVEKIKPVLDELSNQATTLEGNCSKGENCWLIVEKMLRSMTLLTSDLQTKPPKSPGLYLAYHIGSLMSTKFIKDNTLGQWPYSTFTKKPSNQAFTLNDYLMNATFELSNHYLKQISILDLPSFGSMFNSFEQHFNSPGEVCDPLWSSQLNNALRIHFTDNNCSPISWNPQYCKTYWRKEWKTLINKECVNLKKLWREYMLDPEENEFPPLTQNNTLFNFTSYIKDDMLTFLAVYAASAKSNPNQNISKTIWGDVARKIFSKTNTDSDVTENGYYDKLIVDCSFKESLNSHEHNSIDGCPHFYYSLTSNGLCQTFNGVEASQAWIDSEIIQSFTNLFGGFHDQNYTFRGIGYSEGKLTFC